MSTENSKQPYPTDENGSFEVAQQEKPEKEGPESIYGTDKDVLQSVLTTCLAYKVAFSVCPQKQQIEFLQSGYQAIMEVLDEFGVVADIQKLAEVVGGLTRIMAE
jgi:hypothetical protein